MYILFHINMCVLFSILHMPELEILTTNDLNLYCDILEMNAAICVLIKRAIFINRDCFETVLRCREYLVTLISLLDLNMFRKY